MSKLFLLAVVLLFAIPLVGFAQDSSKVEIFGGYSYLRGDDDNGGIDLHGFNVSVNQNIVKYIGVKFDISGHYGDVTVFAGQPKFEIDSYLFLIGPQVNLPKYERLRPYGHVLFGVMRNTLTSFGPVGRQSVRDSAFALAVGGGLDVKLNKMVAVRLFQGDYVLTTFDSDTQNNLRASTGLVLRFGEN